MRTQFDHEKLDVYQAAIRFAAWVEDLLHHLPPRSVRDHLDRASTSIPLNIAEGNGKFSVRDRCRFLDIARGSAVECAACLDVAAAKRLLKREEVAAGKEQLLRIVSMLVALISSLSARVGEESAEYGSERAAGEVVTDGEPEHEHEHEHEQEPRRRSRVSKRGRGHRKSAP
ncbi:four helix bundle protein [bacterium]|nr:four helix bundle protein [bacterium]